ncbi:MAG: carbonic anhydrase [Candidatus Altiarchaeota archaeon]
METQRKILEEVIAGWRKHHEELDGKIKEIAKSQDPKILSLCCSDSRVDLDAIFEVRDQGEIFQVKNVGGLFTEDAKAAFVYALVHLNPHIILFVHHTKCGGYSTLVDSKKVEEEIEYYMRENGGGLAKLRVDEYLKEKKKKIKKDEYKKILIEEGARIQLDRILYFFKVYYPKIHSKIKKGKIMLLPLIYDLETDAVYLLPEDIEESVKGKRKPMSKLVV